MAATNSTTTLSRANAPKRTAHRYEVQEQIARGGMGTVYRALDRASGETVALKRVLAHDTQRELHLAAFEREYQVLASIDHPRIIRVFDYGVDGDGPYYSMELVRGLDLSKAAPLPWRDVCSIMRDVANSLSLLHARHLLHRDLSPGNVKIDAEGHAKLLDFGALAPFGVHRTVIGTTPMVPPEALRGEPLDQRADLYALGALTYWALTGKHAFPASRLELLEDYWEQPPRPPSSYAPEVPRTLDQLVLALLNRDPLARPASAAEVISRLSILGELAPEPESERRRIALSFLIAPPFVAREEQLAVLEKHLRAALVRHGSAVRIEALAGSGRSRLLEEVGMRAQRAGATVLRVDASMHPNHQGTTRALALRMLDALPEIARERAKRYALMLNALGRDVEARLALMPSRPPDPGAEPPTDPGWDLSDWLCDVSRQQPLVIAVDNVESCDTTSLGMLASLAARVKRESVLLLVAERVRREPVPSMGLGVLRRQCHTLALPNMIPAETEALARSLFGDTPNIERFADWLHGRTAGSPLHCLEISRQLIAQDVVLYDGGIWLLPTGRPQLDLPEALEDVLSIRISALSAKALALAQLLSLQRGEPSLALCALLVETPPERSPEQEALLLLDELGRHDVMYSDPAGYRFVSAALRDALLASMDEREHTRAHARLGLAFEQIAGADAEDLLEAGWHFMRGGEALRGANLVTRVLSDVHAMRGFLGHAFQIGPLAEAALQIYKQHRRSVYQRFPLLAALSQAGFSEDYALAMRHGDEALDVIADVAGLRTARSLGRWLGGHLALGIALALALVRYFLAPRHERPYSFPVMMRYSVTSVVLLVAASASALDADRADRIARVLLPFKPLPKLSTARAVFDCCMALQQIGREHQAPVFAALSTLATNAANPRRYPLLPDDARELLLCGTHYARAVFGIFRADSGPALESIAVLEQSNYKLYAMLACQLRALFHANRGEFVQAGQHRVLVEIQASKVGSAWQVELWEPAALLPLYLATGDVVATARVTRRFDELVRIAPSLEFYRQLSTIALDVVSHEGVETRLVKQLSLGLAVLSERPARSFIGWATIVSTIALAYNRLGLHREARDMCERALVLMSEQDRDYTALFLEVDIQAALADAGLGLIEPALQRIDGLLQRFSSSAHALTLGRLHEARSRISHSAGRLPEYREHLAQMERWYRPTGAPSLIAKCERVADLQAVSPRAPGGDFDDAGHTESIELTVRR